MTDQVDTSIRHQEQLSNKLLLAMYLERTPYVHIYPSTDSEWWHFEIFIRTTLNIEETLERLE